MAYTYKQLVDMQSPEKVWEAAGWSPLDWMTDDNQMMYVSADGERRASQSQMMYMLENGDFDDPTSLLPENVMPWGRPDDYSWINQRYGTNFQGNQDYLDYLYGPGGQIIKADPGAMTDAQMPGSVSSYYVMPEGFTRDSMPKNPYLRYDAPTTGLGKWMPAILGSIALAGLGGFLPGTESIFGAGAAGAGAPSFAGGAGGGAATAGAAGGGGALATGGIGVGELAAIGGAGAAGAGAGGGSLFAGGAGGGAGAVGGATGALTSAPASFLSGLGDFATSLFAPTSGSGIGWGDIAKTGLNFLLNKDTASDFEDAALRSAYMSNPLNDPQRQQYQSQLSQLMANPTSFYESNPVVRAQLDLARQQFEANSAKMGVGGTQFNSYLKDVQNIAAGTFNDQAKLLQGLGGFNFASESGGGNYLKGMTSANTANSEAYRGIGDIVQKIFGSQSSQASNPNISFLS